MKRVMLVVAMLVAGLVASASAEIPNVEGSVIYDFSDHALVNGLTSRLIGYKDIDFRVGYTSNQKSLVCLSYDLKNLEKYGCGVKYFWGDWNLTIGGGCAYSFDTGKFNAILMSVLIQINFK